MDILNIIFLIFAAFLLQSEAKPLLVDADYTDTDLLAEESQAFAVASSSAFAGGSNFGGFGYGPAPACHSHHHHSHHYPHYQPASFGPYYTQPNFGYPDFGAPFHGAGKQPNFHGKPKVPHQPMQSQQSMPNNNKKTTQMPTSIAPTISISSIRPEDTSVSTVPTASATSIPIDAGSVVSTTEEPIYDIDIRFKE